MRGPAVADRQWFALVPERGGSLHRSDALTPFTVADLAKLQRLDIEAVYDLRMESERTAHPDGCRPGAAYTVADDDQEGVLHHCTAGKDRTGWSSAALLTASRTTPWSPTQAIPGPLESVRQIVNSEGKPYGNCFRIRSARRRNS
ncbi:tyrosine-protein phosphatase [Streptomyces sp. Marseille-Q5077]|uniref:tyrosine-protein phosphatase n=1 Tax=Streptomyces sp. Marseille-Q5077 TaxID=3418995 RepID=UPI003CFFE4AF